MSEVNYRRNGMKYSSGGKCWGLAPKAGGAVGEYRGILNYFGAADCGIVTSDNTTNKTEVKLNECYELGKSVK